MVPIKSKKCTLCNNPHFLNQCKQFRKLTYLDRIKFVNEHKLCWCCLDSGHFAKVCARNSPCKKPGCTQRHTTLLHPPDSIVLPSAEKGSNSSSDVTVKSGFAGINNKASNNLLPIVSVKVKLRNKDKYVTTQALFDSGSTNSFIAQDLIRQLEINKTPIVDVITQTIQSAPEKRKAQLVTNIKIYNLYESGCLSLHPLLSLPSIPASSNDDPTQENIKEYDEFRDIYIESVNTDVGLLIGNDNRHILQPLEIVNSEAGHYAIKTHVGWVINCPSKTGSLPSYCKTS